jgi:dTMP kinase
MTKSSAGNRGRLYVMEGVDGVGKSTLARLFAERLRNAGVACRLLSFPGRDSGSLGQHVYKVHHNPEEFGIQVMEPTSKQVLHVAAHISEIELRIRPILEEGISIVLDRFWWSTWVYGTESGVPRKSLELMIDLERQHWQDIKPEWVFLIQRSVPFRSEHSRSKLSRLNALYIELATSSGDSCVLIDNNGEVHDAAARIIDAVTGVST